MRFGEEVTTRGVTQRRFDVEGPGGPVPGLLWTPEGGAGPRPLVLLGHGASGHKAEDYVVAFARRLVRHRGYAAAAIDGPVHGDRRTDGNPPGLAFLEFGQRWSSDTTLTDAMIADWRATLDALTGLPHVGPGPIAYFGLSMGTILGLPLVAAEERVEAAVLGLMGLTGPTRQRLEADAPLVACPILFLVQLDDELFDRGQALALFDALGTRDKRLHAHPGRHGEVPAEEFAASETFLAYWLEAKKTGRR